MSQITITLKTVDTLINQHTAIGSAETVRLIRAVRQFYKSESDLETLSSIPADDLMQQLSLERKDFQSIKSALNDELMSLAEDNKNPHAIMIGPNNTFLQQTGPAAEKPASAEGEQVPPRRKFKASEMTFSMPEELRNEFQAQVDRLKEQEEEANKKVRELLEKEKAWGKEKARLEKESAEFRAKVQSQREVMQKHFDEERKASTEEIKHLNEELSKNQSELESLQKDRSQSLEEFEAHKKRLSEEYARHDEVFSAKFDEMSEVLTTLAQQEKEFVARKEAEHKKLLAKDKRLAKTAAEQAKKTAALNKQTHALNAERKKLKTRMKKELNDKLEELQRDFTRRSEYHVRRVEEFEEEEVRLSQEKEKLRIKEQHLMLDTQAKADEKFKIKMADLEIFKKELEERQASLAVEENELIEEKGSVLDGLKRIQNKLDKKERPTLLELQNLALEQERVTKEKNKILKTLKNTKKSHDAKLKEKLALLDEEQKQELAKFSEKEKALTSERKRIMEKEKQLLKRESEELKLLNEEYDELKNSLEVEQIEKEMEFDEKEDKIYDKEEKLIEKQEQISLEEKASAKRIEENEAASLKDAREIAEIKEDIANHQERVKSFLDDIQANFGKIVEVQGEEYEAFKERVAGMEQKAQHLTKVIQEKQQNLLEKSTASELASRERLLQREGMVDTMEKELRSRVTEYNKYVNELAEVKKSMLNADEERQAELRESLVQYEEKLSHLGEAFEDLSEAFKREKESGNIEVAPEEDEKKALGYDEALAKAEWPLAIRHRLGKTIGERDPHITDYIYQLCDKWNEWIVIPSGKFWMGKKDRRESAPYKEVVIKKPFLMNKYPITNVEFYRFINETGYKTEAESAVTAITYHRGESVQKDASGKSVRHSFNNPTLTPEPSAFWLRPDDRDTSLYMKFSHPVTQVTWNDAQAYCRWKSKELGQTVRLPTEQEWEYVASNRGQASPEKFFWTLEEIVHFSNIEESGILETTAVDHYPEHNLTAGVFDLYGNVFEWVQDSHQRSSSNKKGSPLDYKIARGGSFITLYKHIAHWRRLSFVKNYCTSFLGFRTVCDED